MKFLRRLLSNSIVESKYVFAGSIFGDAVSSLYLGECVGFKGMLDNWAKWEEEYANRGFRTVSLDRFIDLGRYGESIEDVIGKRRENDEKPFYHAQFYRENFLGKFDQIINFEEVIKAGKIVSQEYILPSTEQ